MKKSSQTAEEPMGIVIATGARVPAQPQVRAYVWAEWVPETTAEHADERSRVGA